MKIVCWRDSRNWPLRAAAAKLVKISLERSIISHYNSREIQKRVGIEMQTWSHSAGRCVAICLFLLSPQAAPQFRAGEILGSSAENVTLTEYDDVRPIVRVHAARVFMDHEKLGFFRLGLVPLAVVQGVQVQIESARRLTNALANLSAWNRSPGSLRHLEFRDLEFSLLSDTEPRLRAVTARVDDAGGL